MPDTPDRSPQGTDDTGSNSDSLDHPEWIGPYKILQVLGEGGMGVVYEAEQTEPVHRRVALKSIKLGMDTKQVLARFEAERQALAVMDHPGIAKVLDAGATDTGRPYFVMELVKGIPLTEYCDLQKLPTAERLQVFIGVCQAIQHAHQKGVIHRDLKPSNILVTVQERTPVPKVIDFGIAKAVGHRLTERTLATQVGEIVGTPAYMSPEQAEMSELDVDTRTDVFTLGVILYELVTGTLPFDVTSMAAAEAIPWILRQEEPPTPSARFSSLGDDQATIAQRRQADPTALQRQLKGDLDWIVLKAMAKDRTRRYETANGLALDIQRHLDHELVLARAPSATYRIGKFVRRHTAGVAFAIAIMVFLAGFAVMMAVQASRIARERDHANREATAAAQVSDFLVGLFEVSDPDEARGNTITAREVLDSGLKRIATELDDQPLIQAALMHTMGRVYVNLGLASTARSLLQDAAQIRGDELGDQHPDLASSLQALGRVYWELGEHAAAESSYARALAIREAALGPEHPTTARSVNALASLYRDQAKYAEAEPLYQRALELKEAALGPDHPDVATSLHNLAILHRRLGQLAAAESLSLRALQIRETALGADHPAVARTVNGLAIVYFQQEKYDEAERFFMRALADKERVLGPNHPDVANGVNNLAIVYARQERFADAESLYQRGLEIRERAFGREHPTVAASLNNLGNLYDDTGRPVEAESAYVRAIAIREKALGPKHPTLAGTLRNLADMYVDQERYTEAEPLLRRALAIQEEMLPAGHRSTANTIETYAKLLRATGREAQADSLEQRTNN